MSGSNQAAIGSVVPIWAGGSGGASSTPPPIWPGDAITLAETPIAGLGTYDWDIDLSALPNNAAVTVQFSLWSAITGAPGGVWQGEGAFQAYRDNVGALHGSSGSNFYFRGGGEGTQGAVPTGSSTPDANTLRIMITSLGAWDTRVAGIATVGFTQFSVPL